MLDECLEGLAIKPDGIYVDVTFGGGGHSAAIAERLTSGMVYGFDQDEEAVANAAANHHRDRDIKHRVGDAFIIKG